MKRSGSLAGVVKGKRGLIIGALAVGALPACAQLQPIADLYNTGVDNGGIARLGPQPDLHYTFAVPPPTGTVPIIAPSGVFPVAPGGPWLANSGTSAWITPANDTTGNLGDYTYRTTFTIPANVDPSQVYIKGQWTSDNVGTNILINGQSTGITNTGNFPAFDPAFVIQRGFVKGTNTLDFVVNEASGSAGNGGYTGLRVEMIGQVPTAGRVGIPGLKNSGTAVAKGAPLADNAVDPGVVLAAGGQVVGPAVVATSAGGFPIGPWIGDNTNSAWITPAADTNGPEGNYNYQMTFDLTGMNPATTHIVGRWAVDNQGVDILLNGVSTGIVNNTGFADWSDFTLSALNGQTFLPGLNTLTFVAFNGPGAGPTGLRFEFLSATAVAVPEPGTLGLAAAGGALALARRRRR
jgi:hypothetical protein